MKSKFLPILFAAALLHAGVPAFAGSYEAICGGTKCTVFVGASDIRSPYGSIPPERVTDWGGGGDSSTSVGTGVATTILLGPIGLLGFMAKNHDFNFVVNGYDRQGRKVSLSIQFKNDKPAKRFINEMQMITGLGMGQLRTAQEIKNLESAASTGGSTGTLDGDAAAEKAGKVTRSSVQTYSPEVKEEKPKKPRRTPRDW